MKMALIVGINYYEHGNALFGCVNDACAMEKVLETNQDRSDNFDCKLLTASNSTDAVSRNDLKDSIQTLFSTKTEISLFYFAGHGHIDANGGYLLASDSSRGDEGVALSEVLAMANASPATNKVIILDSCHSGIAGAPPNSGEMALLAEGLTVLTASGAEQYATEKNGRGVFTTLLVDALDGSAANLTGDVTPGSVYAHIDQSLGAWEQRPLFKTNIRKFVALRKTVAPISLSELKRLGDFFETPGYVFSLDPSYEPELLGRAEGLPEPVDENTQVFATLQKFNRLNLLVPEGADHMWHAAMNYKGCKLTALGEHYRRLVLKGRIK